MIKDKLLVVDDEEVIRTNLEKLLILEGYEVITAENGQQSLELLKKIYDNDKGIPVKAALVDIKMPGIDGIEVLNRIKEDYSQIEVIMITGHGGMESAVQALKTGAFDYINKPIKYDELSLSISRAVERYRIKNKIEKVSKLFTITSELHNMTGTGKIFDLVLKTLKEIMNVENCSIYLRNQQDSGLELAACLGSDTDTPFNRVIANYPLKLGNEKIGEIRINKVIHPEAGLPDEDREMMELLAKHTSVAITGIKLKNLSIRDGLTSLYNHRHFWETITHECKRSRRYLTGLCLVMIDIDNFKTINDTMGHRFGDYVIRKTSEILKSRSRETDIIFRYGGDEFAVLLTNSDYQGAAVYANSIREQIEDNNFTEGDSVVRISVSSGIASFLEDNIEDARDLVELADKAMYYAKSYGRNRTISYRDMITKDYRDIIEGDINAKDLIVRIEEIYKKVSQGSLESIITLIKSLEARDSYYKNHSIKVMDYSLLIAREMGLSKKDIELIMNSALLHDIGKISISDSILQKKGRLTQDEMAQIRKHPVLGADIVKHIKYLESSIPNILHHHEWYNGRGYPYGWESGRIPLGARIIAVADAFDAMTTLRSYRDTLSPDKVIKELVDGAGVQFFPDIVYIFLQIIKTHKLLPRFPGIDEAIDKVKELRSA